MVLREIEMSGNNNNYNRNNQNTNRSSTHHSQSNNRPNHTNNAPFTKRPATYTFTPLSEQIVYPEWSQQISHDLPFRDGISCSLELIITTHTPILIGGERTSSQTTSSTINFYQQPDGKFAIPGSSLRGAVRSIIEICSFSRMQHIDDKWLSWRDLQNNQYTSQMSNKSVAGWLKFEDANWLFCDTDHEKDEFSTLGSGMDWQKRSDAKDRIKAFLSKENQLKDGDYYRVFTGNTGVKGEKGKKSEFAFVQPEQKWQQIDETIIKAFLQINAESEHFDYLTTLVQQGHYPAIPVFALLDNKSQPTAIGLASMFRLAYKNSIGKLRPASHQKETTKLDFVETLFGNIDADKGSNSLKSRVHFLTSATISNPQPLSGMDVILNSPKPSFYPYYLKQKCGDKLGTVVKKPQNNKPDYNTFDKGELSGYKRYPVRQKINPLLADNTQKKIASTLKALPEKTTFEGRVQVHNLRPIELGALVWAITWGNQPHLRHALGMAKPYGYGQTSINITNLDIPVVQNNGQSISLLDCMNAFEDYMLSQVKDWKTSTIINNLLAQADPSLASQLRNSFPLEHPKLKNSDGKNEFVEIKKNGGYLPTYFELTSK
jgi:hypothetical protein